MIVEILLMVVGLLVFTIAIHRIINDRLHKEIAYKDKIIKEMLMRNTQMARLLKDAYDVLKAINETILKDI